MRHGMAGRKFNRDTTARKAMFVSLVNALITHEQIRTTLPKAKDLRGVVEPLITKARKGDLAARRQVGKFVTDKTVLKKLFDEVAPRFKDRPGGYTRVLKAGFRQGDNAPMAIIELTEQPKAEPKPKAKTTTKEADAPKKDGTKKSSAKAADKKPAKKTESKSTAKKSTAKKSETKKS